MDHEISTKLERPLEDRCCHGVITYEVSACIVCNFSCLPQVSDSYHRVRRRLRQNEPGITTDSLLCLRSISHINKGHFQTPGCKGISQLLPDAVVQIVWRNNVV